MLDTIRNTTVVRCRETVLFSEGPLSEARLYVHMHLCTLKYTLRLTSYLILSTISYIRLIANHLNLVYCLCKLHDIVKHFIPPHVHKL